MEAIKTMQMEPAHYTVRDLVELQKNGMLKTNSEYQRGVVWSLSQKKKLIDSVMREYPLPLIYLHHIKKTIAGKQREDFEIIDGQQRINALYEFSEGSYKLFDPTNDEDARFPSFLRSQPCPWARRDIHSLSPELQEMYFATKIAVVEIESNEPNEIRDLFIRLQAGLPLNAQETRDAWPGRFTDFILRLGGKPELAKYPGHDFFQRVMRMKPGRDRGKTRQLAAQIAMLYFSRRQFGPDYFSDIKSSTIDDYYYTNLDFDSAHPDVKRLVDLLTKLDELLGTGKHPKLRAHDAIHLVLLVDGLWDDYTRSWESNLPEALDRFTASFVTAKQERKRGDGLQTPNEFWQRYGEFTRVNSDQSDSIRRRHEFYREKMLEFLQPLQQKDPKREFGALERELIYFRDKKRCFVCDGEVTWVDADIHHVREHGKGGPTIVANGVLVHRHCHPKGDEVERIAQKLKKRLQSKSDPSPTRQSVSGAGSHESA